MSQIFAADHSTAGAIIGGTLKRDGFQGVVRYAAEGRGNVNITPAEIKDLAVNGIPVAIVCEHEADWLLHTDSVAGRVVGARDITRACGVPDGVVYLAADFDATLGGATSPGSQGDVNLLAIEKSLNVAAGILGRENVGFYGGYYAIDWLVQHGWSDIKHWQTAAWSHGLLHPNAVLYQRVNSQNVAGVQCDIDVVLHPSWGQRVAKKQRKPLPKPPLPPKPHIKITAAGISGALSVALLAYLNSKGAHLTHLTGQEQGVISLAAALVAGYITPASTKP